MIIHFVFVASDQPLNVLLRITYRQAQPPIPGSYMGDRVTVDVGNPMQIHCRQHLVAQLLERREPECNMMAELDMLEMNGDGDDAPAGTGDEKTTDLPGERPDSELASRGDKMCWLGLCDPHAKVTKHSRYCGGRKRHVDRAKMQAKCQGKEAYFIDKISRPVKEFRPMMF